MQIPAAKPVDGEIHIFEIKCIQSLNIGHFIAQQFIVLYDEAAGQQIDADHRAVFETVNLRLQTPVFFLPLQKRVLFEQIAHSQDQRFVLGRIRIKAIPNIAGKLLPCDRVRRKVRALLFIDSLPLLRQRRKKHFDLHIDPPFGKKSEAMLPRPPVSFWIIPPPRSQTY